MYLFPGCRRPQICLTMKYLMLVFVTIFVSHLDFRNHPFAVDIAADCDALIDLVFVIDSSESLLDSDPIGQTGYTWAAIKNFTRAVTQSLNVGDRTRVAAVRYGTQAEVVFHLAQHRSALTLEDALLSMGRLGGNTNTAAALRLIWTQVFDGFYGARSDARNVVVFIGDGVANVEAQYTEQEVRHVKEYSKAEIFTVGISKQILKTELEKMASPPAETHFLHAQSLDDLDIVRQFLVHRICHIPDPEIIITPGPACQMPGCKVCDEHTCFICQEGKIKIDRDCIDCVAHCKVCSSVTTCQQCKSGWYWDANLQTCEECELVADLALVVDNSGSIRDKNPEDKSYDNYQLLKDFINRLLNRVDIGANATRVGAVKFASLSQLVFHLDEFESRAMIQQAVLQMGFGGGHTNISGGLRMMRQDLFREDKGDRPDVENVAVIITDGESTIDKNLTITEANMAKEEGITLFVVGVTDEINEDELKTIASSPDTDHYFNSTDIRLLDDMLDSLIKKVCRPKTRK